jgi:hypothetical protein
VVSTTAKQLLLSSQTANSSQEASLRNLPSNNGTVLEGSIVQGSDRFMNRVINDNKSGCLRPSLRLGRLLIETTQSPKMTTAPRVKQKIYWDVQTIQSSFLDDLVTPVVAQAHKREVDAVDESVKAFSVLDC